MFKTTLLTLVFVTASLIAAAGTGTAKNINYAGNGDPANTLNIYFPSGEARDKPVLIFIHGGSWSSGKKETYWWLGRNFAAKGVVTVIINYPLAPVAAYEKMASDCALAVKWVKDSISGYKGSPEKIFLMGHSAGGHLAELINADSRYFSKYGITNPVKGVILNDAFGLDMYEYLTLTEKDHYYADFIRTFSDKNENWKLGSPLNYVAMIRNRHLIFFGGRTYDAIRIQSPRLHQLLLNNKIASELVEIPRKKHVPMISQMICRGNRLYGEIISFLEK